MTESSISTIETEIDILYIKYLGRCANKMELNNLKKELLINNIKLTDLENRIIKSHEHTLFIRIDIERHINMIYIKYLQRNATEYEMEAFKREISFEKIHVNDKIILDHKYPTIRLLSLVSKICEDETFKKELQEKKQSDILKGYKIRYYGIIGISGYSNATIDHIYSLVMNGADVSFILLYQTSELTQELIKNDFRCKILLSCIQKSVDADIIIIHNAPDWTDIGQKEKEKKKNVTVYGMTVWETENLPRAWINGINANPYIDAVLVPCEWNVMTFKKYIKIPIHRIHYAIPSRKYFIKSKPNNLIFYTIFQWNIRKNPIELINAFNKEFMGEGKKVTLYLKTFLLGTGDENNKLLKTYLDTICNLSEEYPRVIYNFNELTEEEIENIHIKSHCYVLPSRSEGVGLSLVSAATVNPIIAVNYSGYLDYIKTGFLANYKLIPADSRTYPPLNEKHFQYYCPYDHNTMQWASPNMEEFRKHMRFVYENYEESCKMVKENREFIEENFNYTRIAKEFLDVFKIHVKVSI